MLYFFFAFLFSTAHAATTYSCDTHYDQLNVAHIETTSIHGFYYCFGLNHGRERAWQMDFFRRVAQGRNAEVLGFDHLKGDLMMRLLDVPALAEKIWKDFPEENKQHFIAYADGVNEGFKTGKNAKEFKDQGYEPETWLPVHSLSVLLVQSFDQTRKSFLRDYDEEVYKEKWGKEAAALFDEDFMPWEKTIMKEGEYPKRESPKSVSTTPAKLFKLWSDFPAISGLESGSNNWVVSKEKSKTGNALLSNDPHLDLRSPLFWYWLSIKTPEMKVMGGSVPGVPIIATGTNGKVSWGLTNSYLNAADSIYIKDLKSDQIESIRPVVKIKFWIFKLPFFFKSFEKLKSGHRILPLESKSEDKIALRWTGFSLTAQEIVPMFELYKSQNVKEMDETFAKIGVPSWNFVFADNKGNIGYRLVGKTYKQTEKTPFGMAQMTYDELQKEEYFSNDEEPHVMNPPRHYIVTANHRHWPSDAKYYGGRAYSYSFRAFRIEEMMTGDQDLDSFKKIVCDRQTVDARFFLPKIQKYLNVPVFENWDMLAVDSSTVLPLYRRLFDLMLEKWNVNEYALFKLLDDLNAKQVEELKSFLKIAEEDSRGKTWGEFHVVNFPHISKNKNWVFSPEIAGIGDTHTVDPGTSKWNEDRKLYEQNSGASMRMLIEMGKTPTVLLVLPGPNRNYVEKPSFSPWQDWKNCKFTEVKF